MGRYGGLEREGVGGLVDSVVAELSNWMRPRLDRRSASACLVCSRRAARACSCDTGSWHPPGRGSSILERDGFHRALGSSLIPCPAARPRSSTPGRSSHLERASPCRRAAGGDAAGGLGLLAHPTIARQAKSRDRRAQRVPFESARSEDRRRGEGEECEECGGESAGQCGERHERMRGGSRITHHAFSASIVMCVLCGSSVPPLSLSCILYPNTPYYPVYFPQSSQYSTHGASRPSSQP